MLDDRDRGLRRRWSPRCWRSTRVTATCTASPARRPRGTTVSSGGQPGAQGAGDRTRQRRARRPTSACTCSAPATKRGAHARARHGLPGRSLRRGHLQPARAARQPRAVRDRPGRRGDAAAASRRGAGPARARAAAGAQGARHAGRPLRAHVDGRVLVEIFPQARRLRRAQRRPARHGRRARRMLRHAW